MKFPFGVLPLATFETAEEAEKTLLLLLEGGLTAVEIACRTPYAYEAINLAAKKFPQIDVGAGTVLTCEQASRVLDMGATFLVSPGFSEGIARLARDRKIPYFPGCVTPTEIMRALDFGITAVKFFPASVYGGPAALRALSEPFGNVKFLPTGGVTMETFSEYLALPCVEAVGGSFVFRGDFQENCARIRALGRKQ